MLSQDLWDKCVERLEAELPEKEVGQYIRPLYAVLSADQLTLLAPNRTVMDWVRSNYLQKIQRAASSFAAYDLTVNLAVGGANDPRANASTSAAAADNPDEDYSPYIKGRLDP